MASVVEIGTLIDRDPGVRGGRPKIASTGLTVSRSGHGVGAAIGDRPASPTSQVRLYLWAEIEDDGCGYVPDGQKGLGIRSMRARTEQFGGEFNVAARPQGGTRATLRFSLAGKS